MKPIARTRGSLPSGTWSTRPLFPLSLSPLAAPSSGRGEGSRRKGRHLVNLAHGKPQRDRYLSRITGGSSRLSRHRTHRPPLGPAFSLLPSCRRKMAISSSQPNSLHHFHIPGPPLIGSQPLAFQGTNMPSLDLLGRPSPRPLSCLLLRTWPPSNWLSSTYISLFT